MTRTAVLICPGRGTYNKPEMGYLHRHHTDKAALFAGFDAQRRAAGQEDLTSLDGAARFSVAKYSRGDVASPLIYAASLADAQSLAEDIEVVAVTGNSMGWYIALAAAGVLNAGDGFEVVNTMGTLMQQQLIGGQLVYPFAGADWQNDPTRKAELLALVADISRRDGHDLALSIDLGGLLVLAGNEAGLRAFEAVVPVLEERFPMRLANHAAFHTALQAPVAAEGRKQLAAEMFTQPEVPLIDGRGQIWWPGATDTRDLWNYTLGHQVVEPYDFTRAVQNAAYEFAPDLFVVTGPGSTLGGAVAQSLVQCSWQGLTRKAAFKARQVENPLLVAMGDPAQRVRVTG
jgi:acyl transferase domain-containing protein